MVILSTYLVRLVSKFLTFESICKFLHCEEKKNKVYCNDYKQWLDGHTPAPCWLPLTWKVPIHLTKLHLNFALFVSKERDHLCFSTILIHLFSSFMYANICVIYLLLYAVCHLIIKRHWSTCNKSTYLIFLNNIYKNSICIIKQYLHFFIFLITDLWQRYHLQYINLTKHNITKLRSKTLKPQNFPNECLPGR